MILTGSILHALEVKRFVNKKLIQIDLSPDTTLQQLYDLTPAKILLNFAVMESQKKTISFLNRITRPNMPVWAAIVASCSLSDFFDPLPDKVQWRIKESKNEANRLVEEYFEEKTSFSNFFTSAEIITRLPLELVTNEKLKSVITNTPN